MSAKAWDRRRSRDRLNKVMRRARRTWRIDPYAVFFLPWPDTDLVMISQGFYDELESVGAVDAVFDGYFDD